MIMFVDEHIRSFWGNDIEQVSVNQQIVILIHKFIFEDPLKLMLQTMMLTIK